ncbi:MAG: hypothetical protein Q8L95_03600 [Burkholderiales bacterium]|nr:hypothetical protein [Burkholderiales bacterium]
MTGNRNYRYYEFVMAAFVTVLICSNLTGPAKIARLDLPLVMAVQFLAKVGVEVALTPVTYKIVKFLKRAEHEDYSDRDTDFSPFALKH